MLRFLVVLLVAWSLTGKAVAQVVPTWQWARQTGGRQDDYVSSVKTDAAGNFYQFGTFMDTVQCGPNVLICDYVTEAYLEKFDSQGNVVWAVQSHSGPTLGTPVPGHAEASSAITDAAGNTYLSGIFYGSLTLGTLFLRGQGYGSNGFLIKINPQGVPVWSFLGANTGTGPTSVYTSGIALTPAGDLYWTGAYEGTAMLGNAPLTSQGGRDIFLVKLSSAGALLWAKSTGGTSDDTGVSLATDLMGGVYLNGAFEGVVSFGSVATLISAGMGDVFLAHYDAQGIVQFVLSFGGPLNDTAGEIATTPTGDIYLLGGFQDTASFYNLTLTSAGYYDSYILKCSAQGVPLWARRFGGAGLDAYGNIEVLPNGDFYVGGVFSGTVPFDTQALTSAGGTDIALLRLNSLGTVVWAVRAGGSGDDYSDGLDYGPGGLICQGGQFLNTASFGPRTLTSHGQYDGFISVLHDNVALATRTNTFGTGFQLSPNPLAAGQALTIQLPAQWMGPVQVRIVDAIGRQVYEETIRAESTLANYRLDLPSALVSGLYQVSCMGEGAIVTGKLVVQ